MGNGALGAVGSKYLFPGVGDNLMGAVPGLGFRLCATWQLEELIDNAKTGRPASAHS